MNENTSMKQEVINANLKEVDGKDILLFEVINGEYPQGIAVRLNTEEGKQDLVVLFSSILRLLLEKMIRIELVVDENYSKGLFIDVSKEYLDSLNQEIERVYNQLQQVVNES